MRDKAADELRRPCSHRGGAEVLASATHTPAGDIEFCVCKVCRRFWLEHGGWLLSRRDAIAILRPWLHADEQERIAT
jgi:hypothetical protein